MIGTVSINDVFYPCVAFSGSEEGLYNCWVFKSNGEEPVSFVANVPLEDTEVVNQGTYVSFNAG